MNLKMVLYILGNGAMEIDMVEESNTGMMVVFMKDIGETVNFYLF